MLSCEITREANVTEEDPEPRELEAQTTQGAS